MILVFQYDVIPNITPNKEYEVIFEDDNTVFVKNDLDMRVGISKMVDESKAHILDDEGKKVNKPFIEGTTIDPHDNQDLLDRIANLERIIQELTENN